MGIFSDAKAIGDVQRIKNGGKAKLSISQITNLLVNLPDAQKNLSTSDFQKVYSLYQELRKCKTKMEMNESDYYETALDIIKKFDAIAPYEKFSGGNEQETVFLMDRIRADKPQKNYLDQDIDDASVTRNVIKESKNEMTGKSSNNNPNKIKENRAQTPFNKITFTCPNCKEKFTITCWSSYNVSERSCPKSKILTGDIFKHKCPKCKKEHTIVHDCLYHDREKRTMIYFMPEYHENRYELSPGELVMLQILPEYKLRLETDYRSFLEKIRIMDQFDNDKLFEVFRYIMLYQVQESISKADELYFIDTDDNNIRFEVLSRGEHINYFLVEKESFSDLIKGVPSSQHLQEKDAFEKIDIRWVVESGLLNQVLNGFDTNGLEDSQSYNKSHKSFNGGERVRHKKYGDGMVVGVMETEEGRMITIIFDEHGTKVFDADIVKLKKL